MQPKTKQNDKYISDQISAGREYVILGELPHPELVNNSIDVIGTEGVKVYLRLHQEKWEK